MKKIRLLLFTAICLISFVIAGCGSVRPTASAANNLPNVKGQETANSGMEENLPEELTDAAQIMDIAENAKSITVTNAYGEYSDDYIYTDDEKIKTILDFMQSFDLTEADEIPAGTGGGWRLTIIDGEEKEISVSFETVMRADYIRANDRVWKIPDGTRARFVKLMKELPPDGNLEAWESYWDSFLKDADQ